MRKLVVGAAVAMTVTAGSLSTFGAGVAAADGPCEGTIASCVKVEQCDPYTPRFQVTIAQVVQTQCLP